jgi:2-dehydro-3-deoxy-D-arabinonate dehydratase
MKRTLLELVEILACELDFPHGIFLMTDTCLVPGGEFTVQIDDVAHIQVSELIIENRVQV